MTPRDAHYARIHEYARDRLARTSGDRGNADAEARVIEIVREVSGIFYPDTVAANYDYDNVERIVRRALAAREG